MFNYTVEPKDFHVIIFLLFQIESKQTRPKEGWVIEKPPECLIQHEILMHCRRFQFDSLFPKVNTSKSNISNAIQLAMNLTILVLIFFVRFDDVTTQYFRQ